jgi:hypothetical protein
MGPWSAYGKWGDPPGNRLTKWYLAGDTEPDNKSVGQAIVDGYSEAKLTTILHKKGQNFAAIGGGKMAFDFFRESWEAIKRGDFETAVRALRSTFFFNLLPSFFLLLLGPVAMAIAWGKRGRRPQEWRAATTALGAFAVCTFLWALIQWGGWTATTVIHQGPYFIPALGILACTLGLRAAWPRFAIGWLALNLVAMLVIYTPDFEPVEGASFSSLSALLALVGLLGFAAVALGRKPTRRPGASSARSRTPSPASTPA